MDKIYYVSKKEMMAELRAYKATGVISEALGEMFLKIARKYTSKSSIAGYTYRDDMIGDAVLRMISQIDKFNVDHPSANPFCYFTEIAYHQIIARITKEKKQRLIQEKYSEEIWEDIIVAEKFGSDVGNEDDFEGYSEESEEVIDEEDFD